MYYFNHDLVCGARILAKIDIERAYDTLSWTAIPATLTKMKFPPLWILWIKAFLTYVSFSFLINGQPFSWISFSRGVRQGDPISPYLFILASQNLTTLLNFSLKNQMFPGFNSDLHYNFNHLMYADDLIIILHATRSAARFIKLCLSIYGQLTGQFANVLKFEVTFLIELIKGFLTTPILFFILSLALSRSPTWVS